MSSPNLSALHTLHSPHRGSGRRSAGHSGTGYRSAVRPALFNNSDWDHSAAPTGAGVRFYLMTCALLAVGAMLEIWLPEGLGVRQVKPDLPLFVAIAAGLIAGPAAGGFMGLLGGYLLISWIPFSPGSYLVSHIVPGYFSGLPRSYLFTENPLVAPLAGLLAGALGETLFFLLTPRSPALWLHSALIQAVFGFFIVPAVQVVLRSQLQTANS